jgi:hypothetical protein
MKEFVLKAIVKSKKFWYAIGSILIPLIATYLGVAEETAQEIFYAGMALILGQGIADIGKK